MTSAPRSSRASSTASNAMTLACTSLIKPMIIRAPRVTSWRPELCGRRYVAYSSVAPLQLHTLADEAREQRDGAFQVGLGDHLGDRVHVARRGGERDGGHATAALLDGAGVVAAQRKDLQLMLHALAVR